MDLAPAHRGFRLAFDGVSLFGVGTLVAAQVEVIVQCDRCAAVLGVDLAGATAAAAEAHASTGAAAPPAAAPSEWKAWCTKCSLLLRATLRPTLVHEGAPALGYVDAEHASVLSVAATRLACTCLECGAVAELPRASAPWTWEASCRACYARLRVDVRAARAEAASRSAPPADMAWHGARHGPAGGRGALRVAPGRALPDTGTCRHYARSFRWLRFPCCGAAYACDICHDEASDHVHEWARRMICGHCSREQPYSSSAPCAACGRYLTRAGGPVARFWEGGTGQRDLSRLARNDTHKHRGAHKTASKKAARVGPAGAKARAAAAAARAAATGADA